MEDQEIVELYWKRDENAILHTQKKYEGACLTIAKNIVKNHQDAEECVNDSYLKVWNSIPPERPRSFFAFLSRIVRNVSLDRYRFNTAEKRSREADVLFSELEECLADSAVVDMNEEGVVDALNRFLKTMEKTNRLLFVRRYFYMDSNETLASTFAMSENVIRQRLYRMRENLKKFLEEEGIGL